MNTFKLDLWWEDDLFISFLHWMIDEQGFDKDHTDNFNAHEIVYVMEKPWKYRMLWLEFNENIQKEDK